MKFFFILILIVCSALVSAEYVRSCFDMHTSASGWYDPKHEVIIIKPENLNAVQLVRLMLHEYAHHKFNELKLTEQITYEKTYNKATVFVSSYAQNCKQQMHRCTPYEEDYAETFSKAFTIQFNYSALPLDRAKYFLGAN